MKRKGKVLLATLAFVAAPAFSQKEDPEGEGPLIAPGKAPDAAILFLGNLQGTIEPCL